MIELYARFTVPAGNGDAVVMVGAATICSWKAFVAVLPVPSAICTENELVPDAVGVPPRVPPGLRLSPAGKLDPEGSDHVYEPEPPVPVKVNE